MPLIRPLAIDGEAPITTTNRIAPSDSLKRRIANGNHAIDGMLWRPVMNEPKAPRRMRLRETTTPSVVPITIASAKPVAARRSVVATAAQNFAVTIRSPSSAKTRAGPGSTYVGRQPLHTVSCQSATTIPTAASFGQVASQAVRSLRLGSTIGTSSASRPSISCSSEPRSTTGGRSAAMPAHLFLEPRPSPRTRLRRRRPSRCGAAGECRSGTRPPHGRAGSRAAPRGRRAAPPRARCG